ncbi:hypothetical protein AK812_SmicGene870 [Symbiodinium microadriaticum]|uniref:Uncharacterized protein n=1 Tax=Symbiodinium microadriaticum TaxID=2951 RepID=A0A1Q9F5R0_SYMMI|nr:hypothetical protein AK812_SmicGene870 [Symbiodinium microadriaticum]
MSNVVTSVMGLVKLGQDCSSLAFPINPKGARPGQVGTMSFLPSKALHQNLDLEPSQDGAETPRERRCDNTLGNVSNLKLVFAELERGLPSLHRGWRTPDPSPDRTGLPKCAPYAEYIEETAQSNE